MKNLSDFKPFYLYISKSPSILGEKLAEFRKFLKDKIDFDSDFKIFYADEVEQTGEFITFYNTPSFFSEKKIAIIRNLESAHNSFIKMLTDQVTGFNKDSFGAILIILTTLQKNKIDKKLLAEIERSGDIKEVYSPQTGNLKKWLEEKCELDNIKFTSKAAIKLIENVNFDSGLLKTEYEKLHTFIISEKDKTINEKIVDKLVNRVYDMKIFDAVDYIGNKDKGGALKTLKIVSGEKQSMMGLITLLHRMFKAFLYLKSDTENPGQAEQKSQAHSSSYQGSIHSSGSFKKYLERNLGHSPYALKKVEEKYVRHCRKYEKEEIIQIFGMLNKYDMLLRSEKLLQEKEDQDFMFFAKMAIEIVDVSGR
jgi:DNA polymerase III delta subunit